MTAEQADHVWDGDPADTLVSGRRRRQLTAWQKIGVAALVTVVFLTFIWVDYSLQVKAANRQPDVPFKPKLGTYRAAPVALPPPPETAAASPLAAKTGQGETTPEASPILAFGGDMSNPAAGAPAIAGVAGDARVADTLALGPDEAAAAAAGQIVPPISHETSDENAIATRLKPTVLQGSKAAVLPHPDFLITKGTIMPCTLQTAISTELAGYVKCVLPEPVRGTTGNVVLLDKGTTIVGEIQNGLAQGQRRAFVLWDRAETPSHAIVSLASPGADELGRAGAPGAVNTHFWQRFGSALMLTVVQGSFQAGTALAGGSGGGTVNAYLNPLQSNGQQVADTALQSSINIRPTLEKKQGESVSIFVARDIDFSDVYALRVVR